MSYDVDQRIIFVNELAKETRVSILKSIKYLTFA